MDMAGYIQWFQFTFIIIIIRTDLNECISQYRLFVHVFHLLVFLWLSISLIRNVWHFILVISHSLPCETMPLIWCCAKNYVTKKEKNKTERTKKLYPEQGNSSINEPFLYTLYETCMCIRYESYIVSFAFGTSLFSTKSSIFFRQYARILVYSGYTVPLVCICVLWEEIL